MKIQHIKLVTISKVNIRGQFIAPMHILKKKKGCKSVIEVSILGS